MKYIKTFNESTLNLSDDIISWVKSTFSSKDWKVKELSSSKEKVEIEIEYSSPIVLDGYYDRTSAVIKIVVTDYANDYDYSVKIDGKYGKYGKQKGVESEESWRNAKKFSVEENELTYTELKNFINSNIKTEFVTEKKWSGDVTEEVKKKDRPKEGIFTKKAGTIVKELLRVSKGDKGKAMHKLQFYMNRAGDKLTNKTELEKAKKQLS